MVMVKMMRNLARYMATPVATSCRRPQVERMVQQAAVLGPHTGILGRGCRPGHSKALL